MRAKCLTFFVLFCSLLLISGCQHQDNEDAFDRLKAQKIPLVNVNTAEENGEPIRALPAIDDQSLITPMANLGRKLFHDKRLSGDGTLTCASCHAIAIGGDDNRQTSVGIRGQIGPINSPTVLNSGFNFRQFWDGRSPTLDDQANGPVAASIEMGADWDEVVDTLNKDEALQTQFEKLFGSKTITQANVTHAIARYEETLTTPSPFDQYLLGDNAAISSNAKVGYQKFKEYGCAACHQGINIGGNLYQQFGVLQNVDVDSVLSGSATPVIKSREEKVTLVKVPSLRNIALTAPYFHTGKVKDLATAIRVMGYSQTGHSIPDKDVALIEEFLNSLTGNLQPHLALIEN